MEKRDFAVCLNQNHNALEKLIKKKNIEYERVRRVVESRSWMDGIIEYKKIDYLDLPLPKSNNKSEAAAKVLEVRNKAYTGELKLIRKDDKELYQTILEFEKLSKVFDEKATDMKASIESVSKIFLKSTMEEIAKHADKLTKLVTIQYDLFRKVETQRKIFENQYEQYLNVKLDDFNKIVKELEDTYKKAEQIRKEFLGMVNAVSNNKEGKIADSIGNLYSTSETIEIISDYDPKMIKELAKTLNIDESEVIKNLKPKKPDDGDMGSIGR